MPRSYDRRRQDRLSPQSRPVYVGGRTEGADVYARLRTGRRPLPEAAAPSSARRSIT
ncbi:hypothetical protein ACFMQL_36395 [Nonomuraea fastidiosa]|uniref:hypothetical protein n=1 Tax=Nonomuraea TaxID=83681 RepID=UPI0032475D21